MPQNQSDTDATPLQVVLEVTGPESVRRLLATIDQRDIAARIEAVASAAKPDATVEIDLDVLTETQRRTLEVALRTGYYDRPREATLDDLARRLDVSKSAVSQRLNSAERNLVKSAFGT